VCNMTPTIIAFHIASGELMPTGCTPNNIKFPLRKFWNYLRISRVSRPGEIG
ncbi:hypothetical protein L9F63_022247, partial [Diploptera punctata]